VKEYGESDSNAADYYDSMCSVLAWAVFGFAVFGVAWGCFRQLGFLVAASFGAGVLAMGGAFAGNLCCTLTFLRLSQRLWKIDAGAHSLAAIGPAVLADTAVLNASDLIVTTHVRLLKMELFEKQAVDFAIWGSASILSVAEVEYADIFTGMLAEANMIKRVEGFNFEGNMGFSGWIENKKVLFGQRELMINHGVRVPSRDFEKTRLTANSEEVFPRVQYVAADGVLVAMFILGYKPVLKVQRALAVLQKNRLNLLILSRDTTLSGGFVGNLYELDSASVNVVPHNNGALWEVAAAAPSGVFFSDQLFGIKTILSDAKKTQNVATAAMFVQSVGLLFGVGMLIYLLCCGDFALASGINILGYHFLWSLLCLLVLGVWGL
jgi:hypothetical protein